MSKFHFNDLLEQMMGGGVLPEDKVCYVSIDKIIPNPNQPRRVFDRTSIDELCLSIRQYGILQPLLVRRGEDCYELIAGERRLKAAGQAGLREVPVIIKQFDESDSAVVALIENVQRRDLTYWEEVIAKNLNVQETEKLVERAMLACQRKEMQKKKEAKIGFPRDLRLFFNTVNKAIESMKQAGVMARAEKTDCEDYIKYSIIIPKSHKNVSRET